MQRAIKSVLKTLLGTVTLLFVGFAYLQTLWLLNSLNVIAAQNMAIEMLQTHRADIDRLIANIDAYKNINHVYPVSMAGFQVPKIRPASEMSSPNITPLNYEVSRDASFFRLSFSLQRGHDSDAIASAVFVSLEPVWKISHSYVDDFNQAQAEIFGRLYQETRTFDMLEKAVLSLVAAHTISRGPPCPVFFSDYLTRALGPAESYSAPLPNNPDNRSAVVYKTDDGQPGYAFTLEPSPKYASLIEIVDVYRFDRESTNWDKTTSCARN